MNPGAASKRDSRIPMRRNVHLPAVILFAAFALSGFAFAKPYTPADDGVVLERLPEKLDPSLAELRRMRAALNANPADLDNAVRVARRSISAARATGDPRFLGQAQAALAPWWKLADPPAQALLLRATVKQSLHDFPGALADLDRLLAVRHADGQALLTRATILTVQGRYAEAQRDCAKLLRQASSLVTTACLASASSLNGDAAGAYRGLMQALERPDDSPEVRVWALTLAAEIATRRGDAAAAEARFRDALALDPGDAYLQGAYADFLLDQRRPREVAAMLAASTKNDALLLRLTLAEQALPERRREFCRASAGSRRPVCGGKTTGRRTAFARGGALSPGNRERRARGAGARHRKLESAARARRPARPRGGGARRQ